MMLSIPPANSNRAHPPTWWYRQEKWPHALQSQHFCVGCGRERGSSPRAREGEKERERDIEGKRATRATTVYLTCEIHHVLSSNPTLVPSADRRHPTRYVISHERHESHRSKYSSRGWSRYFNVLACSSSRSRISPVRDTFRCAESKWVSLF